LKQQSPYNWGASFFLLLPSSSRFDADGAVSSRVVDDYAAASVRRRPTRDTATLRVLVDASIVEARGGDAVRIMISPRPTVRHRPGRVYDSLHLFIQRNRPPLRRCACACARVDARRRVDR
jgi:hypothetical protein